MLYIVYSNTEIGERRTYLNRIRLRWFPPRGSDTKVIKTPGSTWATHSVGSSSSTSSTTLRPLPPPAELGGVPSALEIPFSLASISFPHVLPDELLYDQRNRSDSASDDSPPLPTTSRLGPVHVPQCLYAPEAFNAISFIWEVRDLMAWLLFGSESFVWLREWSPSFFGRAMHVSMMMESGEWSG